MISVPPEIWWPLGALVLSTGALGLTLFVAWNAAPPGQRFSDRFLRPAEYLLVLSVACAYALLIGLIWWIRPK